MNYVILIEKPDDNECFPIFILEGEEEDVQLCYNDFEKLAREKGFVGTLRLSPIPDEESEFIEDLCKQNLDELPEFAELVDLYFELYDDKYDLNDIFNVPDNFNPEWN